MLRRVLKPYYLSTVSPLRLTAAGAALMAAAGGGAYAQTDPDADAASPREEIVVTARRRAESLQDAPVAVSAFSGDRVDEFQADDISGLQYAAPNVYIDQGDAAIAVIYVRSVGQNDSLAFADPKVGVFVSLFTNAAAARMHGVELELFAQPGDRLTLNGSVGWLDAKYKEFDILVGGAVTDVSDRPLVNAPRWNASLGATFEQPFGNGLTGVLHVDGAYRGDTATEITGSPELAQDRYGLLNALTRISQTIAGVMEANSPAGQERRAERIMEYGQAV